MSLFEVALEYASHRALSWGQMLICGRSDDNFGYRLFAGNQVVTPVLNVPRKEVSAEGLVMVAWLFGRHAMFLEAGAGMAASADAWREAEDIYTDLCLLAEIEPDADAFVRQRQALTKAS